ncbi:MAG: hypothetical protein KME57_03410 [Scytonema hyalinum WJT4-NPBG1]|jgi:hypothetical protein|nr:hypothetical protein [Scytonema hyalinum WJT4-NPBG1]
MPQNRFTKDSSKTDPFVQQFFARIPPKTATTFTDTQLAALKQVFKDRISKRHAVDIKLSMPFFKGFYIVLLLGKEKRSKKRLQAAISQPVNSIFLTISGLVLITFLLGSLYIFKMTSGMNLFPNQEIQIKKSKSLPNI